MTYDENINSEQAVDVPSLPADAAQHYIGDMLVELCDIAEQAQLKDLAALLRLSVAAVEANRRMR